MSGIGAEPEGATPLDPDELEGLRFKHVSTRGELDELEQANVQSGLMRLDRKRKHDVLTEDAQRAMHRNLFGDVWTWAGTFRKTEKNIGIDPIYIGVQLRSLLDDARYWAENGTYSPLEAGARFHHRLVYIHPFPNGNGRHSRIAADEYLKHHFGHAPIDWEGGFDLIHDNQRREEYLKALREADRGDYARLLAFVGAPNATE